MRTPLLLIASTLISGCGITTATLNGTTWSSECGISAGSGGASSNYSNRYSVTFSSSQVVYTRTVYDVGATNFKTGCQTEDLRLSYTYDYTLPSTSVGGPVYGHSTVKPINLTLKKIVVLPLTSEGVTFGNSGSNPQLACTGQSFTLNTETDVLAASSATVSNCSNLVGGTTPVAIGLGSANVDTATGVAAKLNAGAVTYQILAIDTFSDKQVLVFGDLSISGSDGQVESRRPNSFPLTTDDFTFIKR